jgi:26S proteasome regulatory subunit T2
MLELLNQLDGFDARADVKVILATNRIESLDPALLRPGRIDRKIEFPLPDIKTKRRIFNVSRRYASGLFSESGSKLQRAEFGSEDENICRTSRLLLALVPKAVFYCFLLPHGQDMENKDKGNAVRPIKLRI